MMIRKERLLGALICFLMLSCFAITSCEKDDDDEKSMLSGDENDGPESGSSVSYEGSVNGHDFVDLGLSVKWAKCNMGASSPSDYGNYYAWAETITKTSYFRDNYKYYNIRTNTWTVPTTSICGTKNDVATYYWGSKWRMPTQKEAEELIDKCDWRETKLNGVSGFEVKGPNGASIFLPKAGSFTGYDKGAKAGIFTQIWTGSYKTKTDFDCLAYELTVSSIRKDVSGQSVYDGGSVRAVTTSQSDNSSTGSDNNTVDSDYEDDFYTTNFDFTAYKNKITVKFYFSENVSSATIKYGTTVSCPTSKSATVTAKCASVTISGLSSGTKYYFKCVAKSKSGKSCTTDAYPAMTTYQ